MTGQTNEAQWYIARDGKQHGPLTDVEMRTFVSHSYLRPSDLLWRPGMADWQPAPSVFPVAFQAPAAPPPPGPMTGAPPMAGAPQQGAPYQQQQPAPQQAPLAPQRSQPQPAQAEMHAPDYASAEQFQEDSGRSGLVRKALIALVAVGLIGGGAYGVMTYKDAVMRIVSGPPKKAAAEPDAQTAEAPAVPGAEAPPVPGDTSASDPALIANSQIDARLQKIPLWATLKKDFPEWYISSVASADKLVAEQKPELDVATQLVQGLVNLRRQNAPKALAASSEKLKTVASAFLENLRALQAQSVGACYGFISKGEMSPAIVEIMQQPENATTLNAQLAAIFDAVAEGSKTPVKHEAAVKADYDMLIGELTKLGWKEEDLQVFSNPRMLAKREPAQVCKMVQDWFSAHLSVQDAGAQERLLFETLKPVVSG